MEKKCPVCGTEYEEGAKVCGECLYAIADDIFLDELLDRPSDEQINYYNQKIVRLRKLWTEKERSRKELSEKMRAEMEHAVSAAQKQSEELSEKLRAETERAANATQKSKKHPVTDLIASGIIGEYLEKGGKTSGSDWFAFYKELSEDFEIGSITELKQLAEDLTPPVEEPKLAESKPVIQPADVPRQTENRKIAGMVFVEGGTFLMGSDENDCEKPRHSVTLESFYIGVYPVTQKEWLGVMADNPSECNGKKLPVERVTWHDAILFCNRKSAKEKLTPVYSGSSDNITVNWSANGYRLPTEAEWEFAARGGNRSRRYSFSGSDNIYEVGWFSDYFESMMPKHKTTHQAGTLQPNELGIYDMSGNVFEWCWDWYDKDYYGKSPAANPTGPETGTTRVYRGGSFRFPAEYCRAAFRDNFYIDYRFNIGFRLVRNCIYKQ